MDFQAHLGQVERLVQERERDGRAARAVILSRTYDTEIADLWEALTSAERIPRWFLPVEGNLRLGGRFQLCGNAAGEITECAPPRRLATTWEMHGDLSWVEVDLTEGDDGCVRLTLTHTALVSPFWDRFGPGAVGVGWELGLLGLSLHLRAPDRPRGDEAGFAGSPAGRSFMRQSAAAWGEADVACGEDPSQARAAAERTADFYTGGGPQQG